MTDSHYDKLLQYALVISSKKRYTVHEMQKKLITYVKKRKSFSDEHIEPVLERLIDLGYLNDEQFVKDYIEERIRLRPRGKTLLARELRLKGISKDLIESGFDEIDLDEFKIAFELLSRRLPRLKKFPIQKQKMKAYQFLYSKGFKREAIYKAVESCYNSISE